MHWKDMLNIPIGQEVSYNPADLEAPRPIIDISEGVRPRLVLLANISDKDITNVLLGVSYHQQDNVFETRVRFLLANGDKRLLPSKWSRFHDETVFEDYKQKLIQDFESSARALNCSQAHIIEFGPEASVEEIIETLTDSGHFNVVRVDPEKGTATKEA